MSFVAKLEKAELFKKLIDGIKDIIKNANFDLTEEGIMMQAMDVSQVSIVCICILKECFSEYKCDAALSIGLNITNISKILKCVKKDYSLTIIAGGSSDIITFLVESKEKKSEFNLNLIEIDGDELHVEEIDPKATLTMQSSKFKEICNELNELGDIVIIDFKKENVKFSTNGEIGEGTITVKNCIDEDKQTIINLKEEVKLNFSINYLNHFCKCATLDKMVKLSLSDESYILVEFKVGVNGYIKFFLAPKIEEDEEINDDYDI